MNDQHSHHNSHWVNTHGSIHSSKTVMYPVNKPETLPGASEPLEEPFSEVGESDCGEPQLSQYLCIDFAHTKEDTEFQQRKCCEFWHLINSLPEIQQLKIAPQKTITLKRKPPSVTDSVMLHGKSDKEEVTAVSMLDVMQRHGLVECTFGVKKPYSYCSLTSIHPKEPTDITERHGKKKKRGSCRCKRSTCSCKAPRGPSELPPLKTMLEQMEEWDAKHPKSMESPCTLPPLRNGSFQKHVQVKRS